MSESSPDESTTQHLANIKMALKILNYSRKCLWEEGLHLTFEPSPMTGGIVVTMRVRQ